MSSAVLVKARFRTAWALVALCTVFVLGCGGGTKSDLTKHMLVASDVTQVPQLVLDTDEPLSLMQVASASSDRAAREKDLKDWGYIQGRARCLATPKTCILTGTMLEPGSYVLDVLGVEFRDDRGAESAYNAMAADLARRTENISAANNVQNERIEGPAVGEARDEFAQIEPAAGNSVEARSQQIIFRRGRYVIVLSGLVAGSDYNQSKLEEIAVLQDDRLR